MVGIGTVLFACGSLLRKEGRKERLSTGAGTQQVRPLHFAQSGLSHAAPPSPWAPEAPSMCLIHDKCTTKPADERAPGCLGYVGSVPSTAQHKS